MTKYAAILEDFFAKNFTNVQVDLGPINVCGEKGLLLSFVYKFGRVAHWRNKFPPK